LEYLLEQGECVRRRRIDQVTAGDGAVRASGAAPAIASVISRG
jgi:hypothetical protein